MYAKGIGVKKNYKIAEKYYRSSAEKGNPYAKRSLSQEDMLNNVEGTL